MHSKQQLPATRFSKTKTVFAYFIAGHYLTCSSLAYAGPGTFGAHIESDLDSQTTVTRSLNNPSNELPENVEGSPSYLSPFQNVARSTFDWMRESALSGCDRFGHWIAGYAEDFPPAYAAQSFLEIDYANDALFWQGHFNQELEEIKKSPYLDLEERAKLKDLQELVWNGLLSPYTYEKGLRELGEKSLFSKAKSIRNAFRSELKENSETVLQYLRKDLIKSLEGMQNNREGSEQKLLAKLDKKLTYYRNVLNAFDYAETLAGVCLRMEENKGKLALSETQHKGFIGYLTNQLHKINKTQYFQIKAEREVIRSAQKESIQETQETQQDKKPALAKAGDRDLFLGEEANAPSSFFSYPLLSSLAKSASSLVQRGVNFAIENPLQAITMGVAAQAAAVAAASAFGLPTQNGKHTNQLKRLITDTESTQANQNNNINLASLRVAQGFTISGATAGDSSGFSVASAGDFNGDGLGDVIIGAHNADSGAGKSYVIYGTNTAPASMSLGSLMAAQGFTISGATAGDQAGVSVASAGDFNGDGLNDAIIGASGANREAGKSYVIYGTNATPANMSLGSLTAAQGLTISGATSEDQSGYSVASTGDFNGDGRGDVIIGAYNANNYAGKSYVIYGKKGGYPAPTNPTPYIIGVSSGVAVVGILSVSVGLAVTYGDRIRNWIRSYTPLDEDISSEPHGEEIVEPDKTDEAINSEFQGEEVEAVELDRMDKNH